MSKDIRKTFLDLDTVDKDGFTKSLARLGVFDNEKKKAQVSTTQKMKTFEKRKLFKKWWKDQSSIDYDEMIIAEKAYIAGIDIAIADGKGE